LNDVRVTEMGIRDDVALHGYASLLGGAALNLYVPYWLLPLLADCLFFFY
jgi:hypothetical protein